MDWRIHRSTGYQWSVGKGVCTLTAIVSELHIISAHTDMDAVLSQVACSSDSLGLLDHDRHIEEAVGPVGQRIDLDHSVRHQVPGHGYGGLGALLGQLFGSHVGSDTGHLAAGIKTGGHRFDTAHEIAEDLLGLSVQWGRAGQDRSVTRQLW